MNAKPTPPKTDANHQRKGARELTAAELEQVNGGGLVLLPWPSAKITPRLPVGGALPTVGGPL